MKYFVHTTAKGRDYYYYRRAGEWMPLPAPGSPDFQREFSRIHSQFESTIGRKRWPRGAYLYCVGTGRTLKIGVTSRIGERLGDLQVSNHKKLRLLRLWGFDTMAIASHVETIVHRTLAACQIRGEWFETSAETISETVRAVTEEFGFAISAFDLAPKGVPQSEISTKV